VVELPIVYLPGASGRAAVWAPVAQRLARRRRPVLLGYPLWGDTPSAWGDTPSAPGPGSCAELLAWLAERVPEHADLVSLSAGAELALELGLALPGRIRRLVLVTPASGFDVEGTGALDFRDGFRERRPDVPSWFLEARDLGERLALVTQRTLIVVGADDPIAPPAAGERLLSKLPNGRLEIVPGATHDLEEQEPDLLAALIEAHLRR
jgi:pimeloyl-ACP methyl ester carboxylesterase